MTTRRPQPKRRWLASASRSTWSSSSRARGPPARGRRARASPWRPERGRLDDRLGVQGDRDPGEGVLAHPPAHPGEQVADPGDVGAHQVGVGADPEAAGQLEGRVVRQVGVVASRAQAHSLASAVGREARTPRAARRPASERSADSAASSSASSRASRVARRRRTSQRKSSSPTSSAGSPSPAAQRCSRRVSLPVRAHTRAATSASASAAGPSSSGRAVGEGVRGGGEALEGLLALLAGARRAGGRPGRDERDPGEHGGVVLARPRGLDDVDDGARVDLGPVHPAEEGGPGHGPGESGRGRRQTRHQPGEGALVEGHLGPGEVRGVGTSRAPGRQVVDAGHLGAGAVEDHVLRAGPRGRPRRRRRRGCADGRRGAAAGRCGSGRPRGRGRGGRHRQSAARPGPSPEVAPGRPGHRVEELGELAVAVGVVGRWSRDAGEERVVADVRDELAQRPRRPWRRRCRRSSERRERRPAPGTRPPGGCSASARRA